MDNDRKISEAAEAARKGGGAKDLTMQAEQTAWLQGQGIAATDSSEKYAQHAGGQQATVLALFLGRGGSTAGFTDTIGPQDGHVGVVLDRSPFYYESGGQIYDAGELQLPTGGKLVVSNSQAYAGYVVHVGKCEMQKREIIVLKLGFGSSFRPLSFWWRH